MDEDLVAESKVDEDLVAENKVGHDKMKVDQDKVHESLVVEIMRVDQLVRTLREQCPWDREQTHASLRRHLLEETYETLEALDRFAEPGSCVTDEALNENLCEELGDLLYQVWFHSLLASERGSFGMSDVARRLHDKLVARHPHVFGDVEAHDADAVRANWDVLKQAEKGRSSTMDGIATTLPALLRAVKVLKRAAAAGLMEPVDPQCVYTETEKAMVELRQDPTEQHLGDLLLAVVGLGRRLSIDPEDALRLATDRAEQHYRRRER